LLYTSLMSVPSNRKLLCSGRVPFMEIFDHPFFAPELYSLTRGCRKAVKRESLSEFWLPERYIARNRNWHARPESLYATDLKTTSVKSEMWKRSRA
jgi:hypothetical protein